MPSSIHRWTGTMTLLSPLAHNSDESVGTDTKFRRIRVMTPDGDALIPIYSGNALRGKLRRIAALDYLERIGISLGGQEKISDRLYYTMFSGGALQKGSTSTHIEVGFKRELRERIPFVSLFGCAIRNQMVSGKLVVGMAIPIARETSLMTGRAGGASIWDLVDEIYYSRRDDLEDKREGGDPVQMKYTVECLVPGTVLAHELHVRHATVLELSCFGSIMRRFAENPNLGGKIAVGHGRAALDYAPGWPTPEPYQKWMAANRGDLRDYLRTVEAAI